jgi:hypothetical protein
MEEIEFGQPPIDESTVKDTWEYKQGNMSVVYSTEGILGHGFIHNCVVRRGDLTNTLPTIQTPQQLERGEIEHRFSADLSEFVN